MKAGNPINLRNATRARFNRTRRSAKALCALLEGEIGEQTTDALVADARSLVEDITQCFHEFNAYRNALNLTGRVTIKED